MNDLSQSVASCSHDATTGKRLTTLTVSSTMSWTAGRVGAGYVDRSGDGIAQLGMSRGPPSLRG